MNRILQLLSDDQGSHVHFSHGSFIRTNNINVVLPTLSYF